MARSYIGNHFGDEEGIVFRSLIFMKGIVAGFFLNCVVTSYKGSHDHAHTIFIDVFAIELGVFHSLLGCHKGILSIQIKLAEALAVEMISAIEIFNFAGKLRFELGSIEMGDGSRAALAAHSCIPSTFNVISERGDGTQAGDYNSL